jgi:hypothetical protein
MNCLRLRGQRDRGFEFHSRHWCLLLVFSASLPCMLAYISRHLRSLTAGFNWNSFIRLSVGHSLLLSSPMWGPRPDICYCKTGAGFWCTVPCPFQRSHSWVRIRRNSWIYFTVSDSRFSQSVLPGSCIYIFQEQGVPCISHRKSVHISAPSTSRRTTVVVYEPGTARVFNWITTQLFASSVASAAVQQ